MCTTCSAAPRPPRGAESGSPGVGFADPRAVLRDDFSKGFALLPACVVPMTLIVHSSMRITLSMEVVPMSPRIVATLNTHTERWARPHSRLSYSPAHRTGRGFAQWVLLPPLSPPPPSSPFPAQTSAAAVSIPACSSIPAHGAAQHRAALGLKKKKNLFIFFLIQRKTRNDRARRGQAEVYRVSLLYGAAPVSRTPAPRGLRGRG